MTEPLDRAMRFEHKMSDAEALMWNIEKDPWLNPSGAMVAIVDQPIDMAVFRRKLANAVATTPRLRERVVPGLGRLSPPTWAADPEFDLDYHLRHISLPAPGSIRQLYDLSTRLYEDPYDRTRPLWQFIVIDGLEGGRGALLTKLHHTVSDGIGAVRMAERYMDVEREGPVPDEVDLGQIVAEAVAAEAESESESDGLGSATLDSAVRSVGHLFRRQAGLAQRALGEAAIWTADPSRAQELLTGTVDGVASALRQLTPSDEGVDGGSPLWTTRSRRRHLESITLPLNDIKAAGKALGASINDMFVAGAVNGALTYHARRDTPVDALNISFVVSTRSDDAIGGNSFVPTPLQVSGADLDPESRIAHLRDRMAAKREAVSGSSTLSGLAGVANLLPTSVMTQLARSQAAKLDFATSNLRAAPFTMYLGGAKVDETVCLGPVAGTAFNATMISYVDNLYIGIFFDPVAVADPAELTECMAEAYAELAAAGGVVLDG